MKLSKQGKKAYLEAVKILEHHNEWRRGAQIRAIPSLQLGESIDILCKYSRELLKGDE